MKMKRAYTLIVLGVLIVGVAIAGCRQGAGFEPTALPVETPTRTRIPRTTPTGSLAETGITGETTSEPQADLPVATTIPVPSAKATNELLAVPETAQVDSIGIAVTESAPIRVSVTIHGNFPDTCTRLKSASQMSDGNIVILRVYTESLDGGECNQQLVPFEEIVDLDLEGLAPGEYELDVNGVTDTFVLLSIEPPASVEETPPSYEGWVLHDCNDLGVRLYVPSDWSVARDPGHCGLAPLGSDDPNMLTIELVMDMPDSVKGEMDALADFLARRLRDQGETSFLVRSIVYGGFDGLKFTRRAGVCSEAYVPAYDRVIKITVAAAGCDTEGEIDIPEYDAVIASLEFYEIR